MFLRSPADVSSYLEEQALMFAQGCKRVYVSVSGGIDSSVVATLLTRSFGPENTVALYRDIRSKPQHLRDVQALQEVLGFTLLIIDANHLYDSFLEQCRSQFEEAGLEWHEENSAEAEVAGWSGAYASLKSRFICPFAGFVAKAVDGGKGRIFGTGNAEEDVFLRYFDKYGDGAVDNNILAGLTKMEVRQLGCHYGEVYRAPIFAKIAQKISSADLLARGDAHNDETELTSWARSWGYDITLSYGDTETEGNIAWALKNDLDHGVVTGTRADWDESLLQREFGYSQEETDLILFLRKMERSTRHKALGIPCIDRATLREKGMVD